MNPVLLSDLFNFNDSADFEKGLKLIKELPNVYKKSIDDSVKYLKKLQETEKQNIAVAEQWKKTLTGLDASMQKDHANIEKITKASGTLSQVQGEVKKNIESTTKAVDNLTKEQEEYEKASKKVIEVQTEEIKLKNKLAKLTSNEADEIAKLKLQIQEANKQKKEAAKESLGLVTLYQKESKRLTELRNITKDQALQLQNLEKAGKSGSKEFRKLSKTFEENKKEVNDLDEQLKNLDSSLGQSQRKVGQYSDAMDGLPGAFGGAIDGVKGLGSAFKALLANPIALVITAIVGALTLLYKAFASTASGGEQLEKVFAAVGTVIDTVLGQIGKWITGEIGFAELLTGTGKQISANVDASNKLITARRELERQTASTSVEEAKLNQALAKSNQIVESNQVALDKRVEAAKISLSIEKKLADERQKVASKELESSIQSLIKTGIAENEIRKAIENRNLEVLRGDGILESQRIALNELSAAFANSVNVETEGMMSIFAAERELTQQKSDLFEQNLDYLIDIAGLRKEINEREIANEKTTLQEKRNLLQENIELEERTWKKQLELFQELTDIHIDENKLINLNEQELFEYTQTLGLFEIATNRLREAVIEKTKADQDNSEVARSLSKKYDEFTVNVDNVGESFKQLINPNYPDKLKSQSDKAAEQTISAWQQAAEKIKLALETAFQVAGIAVNQFFTNQSIKRENALVKFEENQETEIEKLEQRRERELANENLTDQAKTAINENYNRKIQQLDDQTAKKRAEAQRKEAIAQKRQAIFNVALDTAAAIVSTLAQAPGGVISKGIQAAIIGGLAAVQVAAIKSQPIPAYAKGTPKEGHGGGAAIVGDGGGREMIIEPSGRVYFSDNKPQMIDMPKGSHVLNHVITESIMNNSKNVPKTVEDVIELRQNKKQDYLASQLIANHQNESDYMVKGFESAMTKMEVHQFRFSKFGLAKDRKRGNTIHKDVEQENDW